jgi:hypothetical protein
MNELLLLAPLLQAEVADPNRFNNFLILGYTIMWLIGMIYIASLIIRQRNVQQDLELMHRILQEDEETADS